MEFKSVMEDFLFNNTDYQSRLVFVKPLLLDMGNIVSFKHILSYLHNQKLEEGSMDHKKNDDLLERLISDYLSYKIFKNNFMSASFHSDKISKTTIKDILYSKKFSVFQDKENQNIFFAGAKNAKKLDKLFERFSLKMPDNFIKGQVLLFATLVEFWAYSEGDFKFNYSRYSKCNEVYLRILEQVNFKSFYDYKYDNSKNFTKRCALNKNEDSDEDFEKINYIYLMEYHFGFHMIYELYKFKLQIMDDKDVSPYAEKIIENTVDLIENIQCPFIRLEAIRIMKNELFEVKENMTFYKFQSKAEVFRYVKRVLGETLPFIYKSNSPGLINEIEVFDSALSTLVLSYKSILNSNELKEIGEKCHLIWEQNCNKISYLYNDYINDKAFLKNSLIADSSMYTYSYPEYRFNNADLTFTTVNQYYTLINGIEICTLLDAVPNKVRLPLNVYRQIMKATVDISIKYMSDYYDKREVDIDNFLYVVDSKFFAFLATRYSGLIKKKDNNYIIEIDFLNFLETKLNFIELEEPYNVGGFEFADTDIIENAVGIKAKEDGQIISLGNYSIENLSWEYKFDTSKMIKFLFYYIFHYLCLKKTVKIEDNFADILCYESKYTYDMVKIDIENIILINLGIERSSVTKKENMVYIVNQDELDNILSLLGALKSSGHNKSASGFDLYINESNIYYPAYSRCLEKFRNITRATFYRYDNRHDELRLEVPEDFFNKYIGGLVNEDSKWLKY